MKTHTNIEILTPNLLLRKQHNNFVNRQVNFEMTSLLPEENTNTEKMKQKLLNNKPVKEETRSSLSFPRENLNISYSDLEQGFSKPRLKPSKNTILSVVALLIALLCLAIESWKLRRLTTNTHEIEQLKRDVESIQHRLLRQNLVNELKAFEEQLYGEKSTESDDPGEADIDYADYDSNYDDDSSASHDYSGEVPGSQHVPLTYGSKPSDFPEITSTSIPTSPKTYPKSIMKLVELINKAEAKNGQEFENNDNHKSTERKRLKEEHRAQVSHEEKSSDANSTKHKRDIFTENTTNTGYLKPAYPQENRVLLLNNTVIKQRRSTDKWNYESIDRHRATETIASKTRSHTSSENKMINNSGTNLASSTVSSDVHPPKKYYAHERLNTSSPADDDQLSEEIARSNQHKSERMESVGGRNVNWRNDSHVAIRNRTESEKEEHDRKFEMLLATLPRKLTRRHLRPPRQVYAVHYEADMNLFTVHDEKCDNGKVRHHRGIFKAWRPSDWVAELGMDDYFTLSSDGEITVQEAGLYLVYAQIHYVDEHDDNGFHLLVNGEPIMQCMVHTPGRGHKSRSCFSAQVTYLQGNSRLVMKEVGSSKYVLFHREKSFFGLAKLGEMRLKHHL